MGHVMVAVPAIDVFSGVLACAMPAIDDLLGGFFAVPPIKDLLNINYNILYERIICHDLFNQLLIYLF